MLIPNIGTTNPDDLSYPQCLQQVAQEVGRLVADPPLQPPDDLRMTAESWAFMIYVATYLFFDGRFDPEVFNNCLTEGFDDQTIDMIIPIPEDNRLLIYILQLKYEQKLQEDVIKQIETGLSYLFEQREEQYRALRNQRLVNKISEIRQIQRDYDEVEVHILYITMQQTHNRQLPEQIERERRRIEENWAQKGFRNFTVRILGPQDLVAHQLTQEYRIPDIKLYLRIHIGPSIGTSALEYTTPTSVRAIVVSTTAGHLAELVRENESWIFAENVRIYLDIAEEGVNKAIYDSSTTSSTARHFWLLNNGVTITCKSYRYLSDPDQPEVMLHSPQIVNGCQTSLTLKTALENGLLQPDACLLVRIIETVDPELVEQITIATNNQNEVSLRDLRSNNLLQKTLKMAFENMGFYYETKRGEYQEAIDKEEINSSQVIHNDECGLAALAVLFRLPSTSATNPEFIWGNEMPTYNQIFGKSAEELIYAVSLVRSSRNIDNGVQLSESVEPREIPSLFAFHSMGGHYHIARIMSYHLTKDRTLSADELLILAREARDTSDSILGVHQQSVSDLKRILEAEFQGDNVSEQNLVAALKSNSIDRAINKYLHTNAQ